MVATEATVEGVAVEALFAGHGIAHIRQITRSRPAQ